MLRATFFSVLAFISAFCRAEGTYGVPTAAIEISKARSEMRAVQQEVEPWLRGLTIPRDWRWATDCEAYDPVLKSYRLDYDPLYHVLNYQGLGRYAPESGRVLLVHEYGHMIFRMNLALMTSLSQSDLESSIHLQDLRLQAEHQTAPLCPSGTPLMKEVNRARKVLTDNEYFTFHAARLAAYDELFGDILAVLFTGRGDAVYQALNGSKVNWELKYDIDLPPDYRGRDFTYFVPVKNWRKKEPDFAFYDLMGSVTDSYNALDPVRSYLWANYLQTLSQDRIPNFIQAYFKAVGAEFDRYVNEAVWVQNIEEMNSRFIEAFEREARLYGFSSRPRRHFHFSGDSKRISALPSAGQSADSSRSPL